MTICQANINIIANDVHIRESHYSFQLTFFIKKRYIQKPQTNKKGETWANLFLYPPKPITYKSIKISTINYISALAYREEDLRPRYVHGVITKKS